MTTCRQRGLTLIQVLIVLAIIGILIALILPAIQQAREAARRSQCKNNLKQLGLALHNYHDTHKMFPPGWVARDQDDGVPGDGALGPGWPWSVFILPFIDCSPLYSEMDVQNGSSNIPPGGPASRHNTLHPAFICPSDPSAEQGGAVVGGVTLGWDDGAGRFYKRSNYPAVNGLGVARNAAPGTLPDATDCTSASTVYSGYPGVVDASFNLDATCNDRWKGCFGYATSTTIDGITDGTSNTLLVGERDMTKARGAIWMRAHPDSAASVVGVVSIKMNTQDLLASPPITIGTDGFGSTHEGGCHFLLGDGAVRFIHDNIDMQIYRDLGAKADGSLRCF